VRRKGWRIGLIGLAEYGWMASLNSIDVDEIIFEDFVDCAERLGKMLSKGIFDFLGNDYRCDVVIALTHMRTPNDVRLAKNAKSVDFILGGHDHVS
jgi:5'-nucleotidase